MSRPSYTSRCQHDFDTARFRLMHAVHALPLLLGHTCAPSNASTACLLVSSALPSTTSVSTTCTIGIGESGSTCLDACSLGMHEWSSTDGSDSVICDGGDSTKVCVVGLPGGRADCNRCSERTGACPSTSPSLIPRPSSNPSKLPGSTTR